MNIIQFIESPNFLNDQTLSVPQRTIVKSIYGLILTDEEEELFLELTGLPRYRGGIEQTEITAILPRRSGKSSRIANFIGCYEALGRTYELEPGEVPVIAIIASEKTRQARVCFTNILEKLRAAPGLRHTIQNVTREEIQLSNGVSIMLFPCDADRVRGHSTVLCLCDEVASWHSEGVHVDTDIIDAVRPSLDYQHSKILKISTPRGRLGEIFTDHRDYYGKENEDVLVFESGGHDTRFFNPSYSQRKLDKTARRKPSLYAQEHLALFVDSVGLFPAELIDSLTDEQRMRELPALKDTEYIAFTDSAGGSGSSSSAICIGHVEEERVVIDLVRSTPPPFDPHEVTEGYCELLHDYGCSTVLGDAYSGDWCYQAFRQHNILYEKCSKSKSDIYAECEAIFHCGQVELPPLDSLTHQLRMLTKSPRSGGKSKVSVPARQVDDEANVVCGVCWSANVALYEKPLPPSVFVQKPTPTQKQRLDADVRSWLLGERSRPSAKPFKPLDMSGPIDDDELWDELREMDADIQKEIDRDRGYKKGKKTYNVKISRW